MPESGTPVTDRSQILFGAGGSDVRSEPASESGSQVRPGETGGQGEQSQQRSDDPESLAERLTRYAGYWNLEFGNEQGEGAASGGIPGAFGSINAGAWGQGFFLGLTVVDIVLTIISLGELAALKAAAKQSIAAIRKAGKFAKQAVNAAANAAGDATRAVRKYADEAASVVNTASRNADEAAQFASKNADETSFKNLLDIDELSNNPTVMDRLSRAREFDIGGYYDLTARGRYGRVGDKLDSDEALQNLFVRDRRGVGRHDELLRENPATALSKALHSSIENLRTHQIQGISAEEMLRHHIDQMKEFTPDYVLTILERESLRYIEKLGL
jgi:hypothetical protein